MASADVIKLEFPDSVRKRPTMYVGPVEDASVLLREIVDNSIDELYYGADHNAKDANKIWIEVKNNSSYLVADNARGIPTKESAQKGVTMTKLAVSELSAGSKFNKNSMAIGAHGVGSSCVNALSSHFSIMSRMKLQDISLLPDWLKEKLPEEITDYTYYYCKFEKGILKEEGFKEFKRDEFGEDIPSTITTFTPDTSIYKSARARIPSSLSYVKFILDNLNHHSHIYVNGEEYSDQYQGFGYDMQCTLISPEEGARNPKVRFMVSIGFQEKLEPCEIIGSVNGLDCRMGFHIKLIQNAFDKAFSELLSTCNRTEFMGMRFGIIALCNEPDFSSQTKERLTDIDGFKTNGQYELDTLSKAFKNLMKDNYDVFKAHEAKILEYMKSTEKIGRKEFIKSTIMIASETSRPEAFVPNKLTDCSTTNRQEAELIISEGRSAAGALKQARDPRIHAILGLRGKPLNTTNLEIERVLGNAEMKDLISSIGVGVNDYHDMSEVRYGKVIICADADPDGKSINALCLGALATHLTFLVEAGCVYIAETPLFVQDGKYFLDDKGLNKKKPYDRFKGLGEANADQLKPFVFDKSTRRLIQINMDNWELAREMLTSTDARRRIMIRKKILNKTPVPKEGE